MMKNKLVGTLYDNDTVLVEKMDEDTRMLMKSGDCDSMSYKGTKMYFWEDVVLCAGDDEKEIKKLMKSFMKDPKIREMFDMD